MATVKASSSKKTTVKATSTKKSKAALASVMSFCKTLKSMPLLGVIVAEFIGTFIITASFLEMQGNPLFFGFALIGATLVVGGVSGAHLNPGLTIGAFVTRKISAIYAFCYIAAQVLGATVAWLVLNAFLQNSAAEGAKVTEAIFHAATLTSGKEWYVFFAELLGVTILSLGVAYAIRLKRDRVAGAIAVGFAVLTALYIGMSLTTVLLTASSTNLTFLNPAIAIAANGLSWNVCPIAIYIVAPILGGLLSITIKDYLHSQSDSCDCDSCEC